MGYLELKKVDKELCDIEKDLNFYSFLNPLNREKEKDKFFSYIEEGKVYNPTFEYPDKSFQPYYKKLGTLLEKVGEKTNLGKLFVDKIKYIRKKISMICASDYEFPVISKRLYGGITEDVIEEAREILKSHSRSFGDERVTPEEMAKQLKKELQEYNLNWDVTISSKIVPKISILSNVETVNINKKYNYTKEELERLKVHEMVHILRGVNGAMQPWKIFKHGLARYEETEEGLAICTESIAGKLKRDKRQLRIYAGRLLSINYGLNNSFYKTFCNLRNYFSPYMAYRLTERVKRGLKNTKNKGAFTKDRYYLTGWRKVENFMSQGNLDTLYVGKIGLEHVNIIEELIHEGILKYPKYKLRI